MDSPGILEPRITRPDEKYFMPMDLETYSRLGLDQPTPLEANDRANADFQVSLDNPGGGA